MDFLVGKRVVLLHITFWLLYFSYRLFDLQKYLGLNKAFVVVALPMAFNLVASYLHYFLILPLWIQRKKVIRYALALLGLLVSVMALRMYAEKLVMTNLSLSPSYYQTVHLARVVSTIWDTMSFIVFTGMIAFTVNWFVLESRKRQLENEKLVAELNYLKAQINPHFLFNTLHNLNYLVYSHSDKSTEVIIKLSNIMRYMIYDAHQEVVPLEKEVSYVKDYMVLESIRLNRPFRHSFQVRGRMDDVAVAPLILIPFFENAFKHGISDQEEGCWMEAELVVEDAQISLAIGNHKLVQPNRESRSGFGLENIRKRLELSYPGKHKLLVSDNEQEFHVRLIIERC